MHQSSFPLKIDRKSLTDEEELNIQHMVYEYLKGQNMDRKQVKCTVDDGPVGELVEEITVNHPVLVRFSLLL